MRDFWERLWKRLKAFFRQLVGGKAQSQSSISKSSPSESFPPQQPSSSWVDRPISRYPSLPRRDLLIDRPFESEGDRNTENTSSTQTERTTSRYPAMPRRDLLVERPFGPSSNQSARHSEVERDRNEAANSSAQSTREQTRSSQPNSASPPPSPTSSNPPHPQTSSRPYFHYQIDALESLATSEWNSPGILGAIHYELQFRSRRRSGLLKERITRRLSQLQSTPFVWPQTRVTNGNRPSSSPVFRYGEGLLSHCGYRVGVNGLPEQQRRRILDDIYLRPLPPMQDQGYLSQWGEPQTAQRLQKLAETIAALTRNARRRNANNLGMAIAHWESDLAYLKRTYYNNLFHFQWPRTA